MNQQKGMVSLETALAQALYEEGITVPAQSPVETGRWQDPAIQTHDAIQLEHPLFGGIRIQVTNFPYMKFEQGSTHTRAQVAVFPMQPRWIELVILTKVEKGVRLLHAQSGDVSDVTFGGPPRLRVNIDWLADQSIRREFRNPQRVREQDLPKVPHTRQKGSDNVDLVFIRPNGMMMQVQIALSTRGGKFWVSAQQVMAGQIVHTTHAKAEQLSRDAGIITYSLGSHASLVVPLYAEFAPPGSNYLDVFPKMGPKVLDYANKRGAITALSKCVVAKWNPEVKELPADLAESGYVRGSVLFFNNLVGVGQIMLEDGTVCFAHFKQILSKNGKALWENEEFPVLEPASSVALRWEVQDRRPKATAICVL